MLKLDELREIVLCERRKNEAASHSLDDPAVRVLAYAGMITCDAILAALRKVTNA
jgi:hypothetical protein